jgi:hypothetical protein
MKPEVACIDIWNRSKNVFNGEPFVEEVKANISKYTKSDWAEMAEEARSLMIDIGHAAVNGYDIESNESEILFDRLIEHMNTWFFKVDKNYLIKTSPLLIMDPDHASFFNKFGDRTNLYIYRLVNRYMDKVEG